MSHPLKNISKEVDDALERVKRAASMQRERRLSSMHPKVSVSPDDDEAVREDAKTVEFQARRDDEDTLDLDEDERP